MRFDQGTRKLPTAPRSCLSVPGSSERMLAKAPGLPADELIVDLEDAVAPAAKDEARALVARTVPGWTGRRVAIRVNGVGTPWCADDLAAIAQLPGVASIIVPKVEAAEQLVVVDEALGDSPVRVQALIESAAGLAAVREIVHPRLEALIIGYADLGASLGRSPAALDLWLAAQDAVLVAARAAGLHAIDGPWLGVEVDEAFLAATSRARDLGFDGKWAIHPRQLDALNERFTPSADEVERAREVLDALAEARDGAVALDGQMIDEAVAVAARRTLERAGAA